MFTTNKILFTADGYTQIVLPFLQRETTLVTSGLICWLGKPFKIRSRGGNSFLLELTLDDIGKNENKRVASPESVPSHLKPQTLLFGRLFQSNVSVSTSCRLNRA